MTDKKIIWVRTHLKGGDVGLELKTSRLSSRLIISPFGGGYVLCRRKLGGARVALHLIRASDNLNELIAFAEKTFMKEET